MTIPAKDKARGKKRILKEIEPWLQELGFIKHPQSGYHLSESDGSELVMILNVPTHDERFRVFARVHIPDSDASIDGPNSFAYECPNHPGKKRYNMRFHIDEETHIRCENNLKEWISEILIPWFKKHPATAWRNPNKIKG